ncbi:PEP-CTERM sorting domain-containing protein [Massilia sp. CCM 8733]|uniref:PEP-CTERM sorting domain-containing protein n=1 Tax=Massilia mucilaginosa TaxID=2609282 RepID=A0ABX0NM08_9BURK|nr:PEP-CTERM sorting domain-containing protein [Massilia mucilaginosa]NHZ87858.1 PEP-CTERM sorting domain-containing protein [Massilia mucilaginosa]
MRFVKAAMALSMAGMFACAAAANAAPAVSGQNLIVNGNAEAGAGSNDGGTVTVPGWTVSGGLTSVNYGASGGFPGPADAGPQNRGKNFFAGGVNTPASRAVQVIDLGGYSDAIKGGQSQFDLSGWLGGYATQSDSATLTAVFRDKSGNTLFSKSLAPVSVSDRGGLNNLVYRESHGFIPVGSALVDIVLDMNRAEGSYNDGYADNLSFSVTAVPEPSSWAMLGAGLAMLGFAARKRRQSV